MNLQKLFEMQKKLDDRIVKEKGLEGHDLLDKKILALQVELGELANEWRGFKFWSEDQEPRNGGKCNCDDGYVDAYMGDGVVEQKSCERCEGTSTVPNTLLEEYVDCLHFILSIGLEKGLNKLILDYKAKENEITRLFIQINLGAATLLHFGGDHERNYRMMVGQFIKLGEMLGFTWKQVEQGYFDKNKVNHERQANGY